MRDILIFAVCCFLGLPLVVSQSDGFDKNPDIRMYFRFEKYQDAISLINSNKKYAQNEENMLLAAIGYYHLNQLEKSEVLLRALLDKQKNPYPEIWLFLGKINHHKHQFGEASDYYRQYLRNLGNNLFERSYTWNLIRMCANGLQLQYRESAVFVENVGRDVNTPDDEFAPKPSPNFGNRLYFSSIRSGNMGGAKNQYGITDQVLGFYKSDMFSAVNKNGVWTATTPMHYLLNSPNHDILLGFDPDGQKMYYFQGASMTQGVLMENIFRQEETQNYNSFPSTVPLDLSNGDDTPHFVSDDLVFFSSKRDGGYGGYDLYKMERINGAWQAPVNLGSKINTPADERSPFLARDGITLYFSSNDSGRSIGGLDIFKATFVSAYETWTDPENLGLPINSAGDEDHFYLNPDGFSAFFSSSRKDGYGQRDIYIAYFDNFLPEMEYTAPVAVTPAPSNDPKPILTTPEHPFSWDISNTNALPEQDFTYWQTNLLTHPDVQLLISIGFPFPFQGKTLEDFISLGEKLKQRFAQSGVSSKRLHLRFLPQLQDPAYAQKGVATLAFSFFQTSPGLSLPEPFRNPKTEASTAPINFPFMYKVQIASSKSGNILNIMQTHLDEQTMIEKTDTGFLRLTVGAFDRFADANAYKKTLAGKGLRDAYIVPFVFRVRAEKSSIELFSQQFPDFLHFLDTF